MINILKQHEKHIASLALLGGFIFDSLTLRRADLLIENIFLLTYIFLVAYCIVLINKNPKPWHLILMQFCLGNLFSAFLIFYSRSASLIGSWPFLLLLLILMIMNERVRERYARLTYQVTVYFMALFSYAIFLLPVLLKKMGSLVFVISGLFSLLLLTIFLRVLYGIIPQRIWHSRYRIALGVGGVYFALNLLYFSNIIPPIPLSLKEIGIYESVERQIDGSYKLVPEDKVTAGESVYGYSAVFAPIKLNVRIIHVWEYFDPNRARWVGAGKIPFNISGGRDGGYRGYSIKDNLTKGLWRVSVETEEGKLIGRKKFRVY